MKGKDPEVVQVHHAGTLLPAPLVTSDIILFDSYREHKQCVKKYAELSVKRLGIYTIQ